MLFLSMMISFGTPLLGTWIPKTWIDPCELLVFGNGASKIQGSLASVSYPLNQVLCLHKVSAFGTKIRQL